MRRAALCCLMVAGCASGPSTRTPEVRPIDEDQLALLPAGADAVVDVDMEQLHTWPPARRFFSLLPADARGQLEKMGVDPWVDLDGIVLALSQLGSGHPQTTMLLRGDLDADKMAKALGATFVDYRQVQIGESGAPGPGDVGQRAIARLSPRMVVLGSPVDVRHVVDLVRGQGESVRTADRPLVAAFARSPSAKSGRPAVVAAAVPSEVMKEALKADDLPGSEYEWLTFVLAVGDGFDFEIIGKAKSLNEASSLAAGAKASLEKLRARPAVRLLGILPYLEDIVVADRNEEVRIIYRLAERRVNHLLSQLEELAAHR